RVGPPPSMGRTAHPGRALRLCRRPAGGAIFSSCLCEQASMTDEERPGSNPLRVMLVDDHEVVRNGLRAMLEAAGEMRVVAEAGSVADAIAQAERTHPDVVVMDVRLADGSGIEATREIRARRPEIQVLMLTSFADDEALFASIMAGASGYVLKQIRGLDLVRAI